MKVIKNINGIKFNYFGLLDEDQEYPLIEPSKKSTIDGYSIGEKILEDIKFDLTIQEDGSLKVEMPINSYTKQLDIDMWEEEAVKVVLTTDCFGDKDVGLIMENNKYSWELKAL